jgi:hypothetical protein
MLSILFYLTRSDMIEDNMIRLKEGHEAAALMPPAPNMPECHHWQVCVCVCVCVCVDPASRDGRAPLLLPDSLDSPLYSTKACHTTN